jgi:[ribosomal protein S18]-alanine N-acetyltransferase
VREALSEKLEIEEMREDHLPGVLAIEKESFAAPWSKRLFQETIAFPLSINFVLLSAGKVIGYTNIYVVRDEAQILNIAIHPRHRGKGCASFLLSHVLDVLKEKEVHQYLLEVREGNEEAIGLYRKYGFQTIGRRKKYYRETNEDALVMELSV